MKVMQINCVYKTGSTGKIVYDIHTELKKNGVESVVCYGRGKKINEPKVYKTSSEIVAKFNNVKSRFTGMPYGGCFFATNRLLRVIKQEKPDVVHLHCINGFFVNIYRLVSFLKRQNIATVVTHHAEFLYTANCGYAYECENWKTGCGNCPSAQEAINSYVDRTAKNFKNMEKAFKSFPNLISAGVSPWVSKRAGLSPIFEDKKNIAVLNGIDCNIFRPCGDAKQLKAEFGLPLDKKVIIHVTSSFESKAKGGNNLRLFAQKIGDDAVILVVGNRETPSNLPKNIIAVGRVENQQKLAECYSMADVSVIVSKKETFSMPVAESLCCGTPVIGFKAGGPETISISKYSEFVEYGDIDALYNAVLRFLSLEKDAEVISREATAKYDKKEMVNNYIQLYNKF